MIESFAQMFEESLASQRIRPGQILTGRVIEVGPDVVVVSAGLKSEAVIPTQQFKNERGEVEVSVGDDAHIVPGIDDRVGADRRARVVVENHAQHEHVRAVEHARLNRCLELTLLEELRTVQLANTLSFVHDNALYASTGPVEGWRANAGASVRGW